MIPTAKQTERMRIVGMTFLNLAASEPPECRVDMMSTSADPVCGTVACHAGWWAIAQAHGDCIPNECCDIVGRYGYEDAASDMAMYLGFEHHHELDIWAYNYASLWGKELEAGESLFANAKAFNETSKTITLEKIGLWWLQVADRCDAAREVDYAR